MKQKEQENLSIIRYLLCICMCSIVLCACARKTTISQENIPLGVIAFYQPTELKQIFAGKIFPYRTKATIEEEEALTSLLLSNLKDNTQYTIVPIAISTEKQGSETPLEYWSTIGKEQGVALLIIPQIMEWKQGEYTRDTYIPPKVVIEYYLLDVEQKRIIERSRYYDEYMHTEYDLRYNTPPNGMFFKKRPQCMELAIDSIYKMMMDFAFIRNKKERNIFAQ